MGKYKLGSKEDPVMTLDLAKFDNYTRFDVMYLKRDLRDIMKDKDTPIKDKAKARKRYQEVIKYIEEKLYPKREKK